MIHRHTVRVMIPILAALGLGLSGCDEVRQSLGYTKTPPDEFAVVARAPLSVPPDFAVRPPTPGAERPQEPSRRDAARTLITGGQGAAAAPGRDAAVLRRLLALNRADPEIRDLINRDAAVFDYEDESFIDSLLFWKDREARDSVVDPQKESQRLQSNAEQGRPVTDGETPTIRRKGGGLLDGLF